MPRIIFCIGLGLIFAISLHAQGLNNNYPTDATDIKNSLKLLGIENYKFPFAAPSDDVYLNYITEEYNDTTLIERVDNYRYLLKNIDEKHLKSLLRTLKLGQDTDFMRIVYYDKPNEPFQLQLSYKSYGSTMNSKFDRSKYGTLLTRGYTFTVPKLNEQVPVLAIYAHRKGAPVIHCAGDTPPEKVKKMYEYTYFVYVELIKLK